MTYMITANGGRFDLELANPAADISALEIAASLAKINRWLGHTRRPYSVAEHSVHVCDLMEREHAITHPAALLCGLMHDAHEAYTGDMPSPHKAVLGGAWARFEQRVQQQVLQRFGLLDAMREWHAPVKRADDAMLATEARDLLPDCADQRRLLADHGPPARNLPIGDLGWMTWADWRDAWLDRFGGLRQALHDLEGTPA